MARITWKTANVSFLAVVTGRIHQWQSVALCLGSLAYTNLCQMPNNVKCKMPANNWLESCWPSYQIRSVNGIYKKEWEIERSSKFVQSSRVPCSLKSVRFHSSTVFKTPYKHWKLQQCAVLTIWIARCRHYWSCHCWCSSTNRLWDNRKFWRMLGEALWSAMIVYRFIR